MRTFATLFQGGGGADLGLSAAGLRHAWGVEYDPAIAAVADANGFAPIVADARNVDYASLPLVDWLHASPVCTRASNANPGATESDEDLSMADAVVCAIRAQQPQVFSLENVWFYRNFDSFKLITAALGDLGYMYDFDHINAADFGVPQTRKRLILRASRGLLSPLPPPVRWVGWYEAIEDLLPTLPESQLAPWQLARLPSEIRETMLVETHNTARNASMRLMHEPATTLALSVTSRPSHTQAILLDGNNGRTDTGAPIMCNAEQPSFTLTGSRAAAHRAKNGPVRRCVSMTPRALARFQSIPDTYKLPERRALAAKIIGNAVPPLLMQRIAEGMIAGGSLA